MELARAVDEEIRAHAQWLGVWQSIGWTGAVAVEARKVLDILARRDGVRPPKLRVRGRCAENLGEYRDRGRGTIVLWTRDTDGELLGADLVMETLLHEWEHVIDCRKRGNLASRHTRTFCRRVRDRKTKVGVVDPVFRIGGFLAQCVAEAAYERWIGPLPPRKR